MAVPPGGVVVSGEASESDEEEVNTDEIDKLPPLKGNHVRPNINALYTQAPF